jgi:esterase/lipase
MAAPIVIGNKFQRLFLRLPYAPIHLFNSVRDMIVPVEDAETIASGVSSKIVKIIKVDKSGHVLSKDVDREFIMEKSLEFVLEICNS